jgi:hypothetical protein
MAEDEDMEHLEKLSKQVNLGLAHAELTRWGAPPRSELDKDKILESLFVSRAEYEQYVSDLREREARERKEAETREIVRQAQVAIKFKTKPAVAERQWLVGKLLDVLEIRAGDEMQGPTSNMLRSSSAMSTHPVTSTAACASRRLSRGRPSPTGSGGSL